MANNKSKSPAVGLRPPIKLTPPTTGLSEKAEAEMLRKLSAEEETDTQSAKTKPKKEESGVGNTAVDKRQAMFPGSREVLNMDEIIQAQKGQLEEDGYVTRNFRLRRRLMNKIKLLTNNANSLGRRTTQDDILNGILEDYFEIKSI